MTPQWQIGSALVLGCFLAGPSLADIINVSVAGEVNGNEDLECSVCMGASSGFLNSKSQLGYGMYALSGSGGATVNFPVQETAAGSAQQTADTTSSSFSLDLKSDANSDGASGFLFGSSNVYNSLTLSFHLTQLSILDLNGSLSDMCFGLFSFSGIPCSSFPYLFSSLSAESIDLSGSGFDFNQQADFFAVNNPVNFSATLSPGEYTLTASSSPFVGYDQPIDASFEISLNADFTAAIPEPTSTISVPILLLVVLRCASLRRRRRDRLTA
jgi:hypothetical protein